jgi:DNA polymerase-4
VERVIMHVDMDAFYAAIEQRDRPELRGKPVLVGGLGRRAVVSTASYEARPFGAKSAMPMSQARRLCPHAIVVPPRMDDYVAVSREVMAVLDDFSPVVEQLGLDEAFVDMTGTERLFGPPDEAARKIKAAIVARTRLTASVGIAENKFLAKLASDLHKPDGITWIPPGGEAEYIAPLPVRKLWGVGPKAEAALHAIALRTIGDVARSPIAWLRGKLGAGMADHLHAIANARDDRHVEPQHDRRSVGSEVTLEFDVRGYDAVAPILRRQCQHVAEALRRSQLVARGLRVKLRDAATFRLTTRQGTLPHPSDDSGTLFTLARELLARFDPDRPIRLVGAAAFHLADTAVANQQELFAKDARRRSQLEHTIDRIRDRFGDKITVGQEPRDP